jgi:PAS domain S-box-containing protein
MNDDLLAIKDVNRRLRDIIRLTSDLVWEADRECSLLSISDNALEHLGMHPSELAGREVREIWKVSADQQPEWLKPFRDVLAEYTMPDGSIRYFQLGGLPVFDDRDGSFVCVRGIAKNITATVNAERVASVRERQFGTIAEASGAALLILSSETFEIVYCNTAAEKMFHAHRDDLLGIAGGKLVVNASDRQFFEKEVGNGAKIHNRETRLRPLDGGELWSLVSMAPIEYEDSESFLTVITDISLLKMTEMDLLAAKEEADQASRAKTDFLSSMSHELRTPMNSILGFGQLLFSDSKNPLTEEQLENLDYILKGGQHLLDLIGDVLDFANIETGVIVVEIGTFRISNIVAECLPVISNMADLRGIEVENALGQDFDVLADPTRSRQVLLNLLSNAVKYNKPGGKIRLSASISGPGKCRISVSDTGPGIPVEKHDQLFQPFSRLGAENTDTEGTGIGLSISTRLVELMNGDIGFENNVEEGATFWFELPIADAALLQESVADAGLVSSGVGEKDAKAKLLYVEDNPANLKLMKQIIRRQENVEMISAHTAELGIGLAQTERPDLIILDINLPGMDGFEALAHLRSNSETKNIPVIALSADAMPLQVQRGMDAGFIEYLTKPIDIDRFQSTLNRLLIDD